jgi:hypothetical protein
MDFGGGAVNISDLRVISRWLNNDGTEKIVRPATFDDIKEVLLGMGAVEVPMAITHDGTAYVDEINRSDLEPGNYLLMSLEGEEE